MTSIHTAREAAGLSQRQLAQALTGVIQEQPESVRATFRRTRWDQSSISRLEQSPTTASVGELQLVAQIVGVPLAELLPAEAPSSRGLSLENQREQLDRALAEAVTYSNQVDWSAAKDIPVPDGRAFARSLGLAYGKPRLAVFGKFDSGKSTLLNTLIGDDVLPTGYQPVTSAVVYVRHVADRPGWLEDDVIVFGPGFDEQHWSNERECEEFELFRGSLKELDRWVNQQQQLSDGSEVEAVEVFLDIDLLRSVTLIDVPGVDSGENDDENDSQESGDDDDEQNPDSGELNDRNAKGVGGNVRYDAAVFMDHAASFLGATALAHLLGVIENLPSRSAGEAPLRSLVIGASHAHPGISEEQLAGLLDAGAAKVSSVLSTADISDGDDPAVPIRDRMVPFYRDTRARREPLLTLVGETLSEIFAPQVGRCRRDVDMWRNSFLTEIAEESDAVRELLEKASATRGQWDSLRSQRDHVLETMRLRGRLLSETVRRHESESLHELEVALRAATGADQIEELIRASEHLGRREAVAALPALVEARVTALIEHDVDRRFSEIGEEIDQYLENFSSLELSLPSETIKIPFNARGTFLGGISSAAAVAGVAAYSSTLGNLGAYILVAKAASIASSFGISTAGGAAAWTSGVAAIGGPITLGVAAVVAGTVFGWSAFRHSWEHRLAAQAQKTLAKRGIVDTVLDRVGELWTGTLHNIDEATRAVEDEWVERTNELRDLADAEPRLRERVVRLLELSAAVRDFPEPEATQP